MTQEPKASTEPVLQTEPASLVAETTQKAEEKPAEPQVLTKEYVQQMIADATAGAVEQAKQLGRRELQSEQDRNKAELARMERRAKQAESTLGATRTHLQSLDPDAAKEFELAQLRAEREGRQTTEQEEQMAQYQANVVQGFHDKMSQFITGLGLNPADPKIDWANDAPDLLAKMGRIQDSVAKIQKENAQTIQSGLERRLKELESQVKKVNVEVNSVETTAPTGVVAGSDAEFVKKFGSGELPFTKVNKERYEKIQQSY